MKHEEWEDLVIERRVVTPPLDDVRFRDWMDGRPIFVSSAMDEEMTPSRDAVRNWIEQWGGEPVMWEEITPRDQQAQHAYLDGVDRSNLVVLLLGARYGVSDHGGYSPTHREANRAAECNIPRLLFERAVGSSARDGRLNDWIRSLHNEISGAQYESPEDLVRMLERRLREIASTQETLWVKLGTIVFPGTVTSRSTTGSLTYEVRASLRELAVRRAVHELQSTRGRSYPMQLTWGMESVPLRSVDIETNMVGTSVEEVAFTCSAEPHRTGSAPNSRSATYNISGQTFGPSEQVSLWCDQALFGAMPSDTSAHPLLPFTGLVKPTLLEILVKNQAHEGIAVGLTHLFVTEGLLTTFGGRFEQLEVGPATATAIRLRARFVPYSLEEKDVRIEGVVPLR